MSLTNFETFLTLNKLYQIRIASLRRNIKLFTYLNSYMNAIFLQQQNGLKINTIFFNNEIQKLYLYTYFN